MIGEGLLQLIPPTCYPPPLDLPGTHGSAGYNAGCRCETCSEAQRRRMKRNREARRQRGLPEGDPRHGTVNGYTNWFCKCPPCAAAGSTANALRRPRNRRRTA